MILSKLPIHMFNLLYSLLCFTLLSAQDIPVKGYSMVWNDEFNGKLLNTKKWDHRGLGRRDDSYISEESVRLDGSGHLIIEVFQRNDSILTGMISTEKTFEMKYGYFECRARFTQASGTFPAFWLQSRQIAAPNSTPEKNGVELDIFEYYPHAKKGFVSHGMHWGGYGADHQVGGPVWGKLEDTPDDFHTIGLEWTENSYTTFVDGKKTFSGNEKISHVPEFIVLSLGINKTAAGPLNTSSLPDQFVVDYVRIYKKN